MTVDPKFFPAPPKWATYRPHRPRTADFVCHRTLGQAKNSISQAGGDLFEWSGSEWILRASLPFKATKEQRSTLKNIQPLF